MTAYLFNAIALFVVAWFISKLPCCQNNRGEFRLGKLTENNDVTVTIGNTVYTARGFYKHTGRTLSEKLLRNMQKDLQFGNKNTSGNFAKDVIKYE